MAQYVYRRPPYPHYDIEGIESWLEDLIADGLWLDKDGYVFGMMQFRPGTPRKLKYRLEPIEKWNFLGLGQPKEPDEKALSLYEEFGWEYLGTFFDFYIYRSMDEAPIELNTDPTLQAQALRHVRRRSGVLLSSMLVIVGIAIFLLVRDSGILLSIIERGWERPALLLTYSVVILLFYLVSYLHTVGLQKKLERGETLKRNKIWRKGRFLRRLLISLPFLIYVATSFVSVRSVNAIYDNAVDPETYQQPLPFVTIAQIDENRTFEAEVPSQLSIWSTPITPTNIYWVEYGSLNHPEKSPWIGGISVYYHEAANKWLAEQLFREYIHEQEQYMRTLNAPGLSYKPVEADPAEYGFQELVIYDSLASPVIFIRYGNTVIKAFVHVHSPEGTVFHYPLWLTQMAEKYA